MSSPTEAEAVAPAAETGESAKKYDYVCIEKSVLYPWLKKFLWAPAMPLVPRDLAPNSMTLIGNGMAWLAFIILLVMDPANRLLFLIPAFLNFMYLSLDNMDGMQARRSQRSSPLGEFLDHWADSFISTMMVFGFGIATRLEPWILLTGMGMVGGAFFATFWEQRHARRLVFGHFGSVEALIAIQLFFIHMAIFGIEPLSGTPRIAGYSISSATFALVGLCSGVAILGSMWRVGRQWSDFLPQVLVYATVGLWYAFGELPLVVAGFLFMLTNSFFGGAMVMAKVLADKPRKHDFVLYGLLAAGAAICFAFGLSPIWQGLAAMPALFYMAARLVADFLRTVGALREHLSETELLSMLVPRMVFRS